MIEGDGKQLHCHHGRVSVFQRISHEGEKHICLAIKMFLAKIFFLKSNISQESANIFDERTKILLCEGNSISQYENIS